MENKSATSKFIFWISLREGLRMKGEPLVCASEYEVKSSLSFFHFLVLVLAASLRVFPWIFADFLRLLL